jgi:hypothetical protein
MPYNPKSLLNLKSFKKGKSGNQAGRPPALATQIKAIPKDAQVKVYEVLHYAISLPNVKAAKEYLESDAAQDAMGEYGFLLQIAVKSLMSKSGWLTVCDIMDRLFGKPKQTTTLSGGITIGEKPVIVFGDGDQPETQQKPGEAEP